MVTNATPKTRRFLCIAIIISFICTHSAIITQGKTDSTNSIDIVQNNINIYEGSTARNYNIEIEIFSSDTELETIAENSIVLLLDVGSETRYLAEEPGELQTYKAGLTYPSIDQTTALYTLYDGKYVPIKLKENQWYLSDINEDGVEEATGEPLGTRSQSEDSFIQDVYAKGDTMTVWECQQNAVEEFISRMARLSPESEVGLVFFSGTVQSTSLYKLNAEGTTTLKEALAEHTNQETGQNFEEALKQANKLMVKSTFENRHIVIYTASDFGGAEDESKTASTLAQDMKMDDEKLHIIDFSKTLEASEFFTDITSKPVETYYHRTAPSDLNAASRNVIDVINRAQTITATYVIDPRFILTDEQKAIFAENDVQVTEESGTEISWEVMLPRSVEYAECMKIEIQARNEFFGGNDVPVSEAGSGIYQFGEKVCDFQSCSINVPLNVQLQDIETDIFLGQGVPVTLKDKSIEDLITEDIRFEWFGKDATGEITYFWHEQGESSQFERISELKNQKPGEDKTYVINMTYIPGSVGDESIGTPIETTQLTAEYKVNVVSGTVMIQYDLTEQEDLWNEDSYVVFKLSNERFTQYATLMLSNRNEDGEKIKLEAFFNQIPYGVYTLTQEYNYTDGLLVSSAAEVTCTIGLEEGSDKIDLSQTEYILYFNSSSEINLHEKEGYYTQTKVNRFNIEK